MRKIANLLKPAWPVFILLFLFWLPSFYALNFGIQWDEPRAKFDSVKDTVNTGVFMQVTAPDQEGKNYNHGGVNYLLTWLGFAPEVVRFLRQGNLTREALAAIVTPVIYSMDARVRVRRIYVVLSALAILWLYYLNVIFGRSRVESFL